MNLGNCVMIIPHGVVRLDIREEMRQTLLIGLCHMSGAPYGYRYVSKHVGGGSARYDILEEEARVVRQIFTWIGQERLSIGEVCRRLQRAEERTRTGRTQWDRRVVWGILKNPAYKGTAAFGKTRSGPLRPRLRAQRHRPLQPRHAVSE